MTQDDVLFGYVDRGKVRGVNYTVALTVTNDGREFQSPSFVEAHTEGCSEGCSPREL